MTSSKNARLDLEREREREREREMTYVLHHVIVSFQNERDIKENGAMTCNIAQLATLSSPAAHQLLLHLVLLLHSLPQCRVKLSLQSFNQSTLHKEQQHASL